LEKLRYIHRNPVRRGLVLAPEQWKWSSYLHYYATGEVGPVFIDQGTRSALKIRSPHSS
jgi:putative transposase